MDIEDIVKLILKGKKLVFLTGAGVSTASGIPDYRSINGVYQGKKSPEYLLSKTALNKEPDKFYDFVKHLYHPEAKPNIIHKTIAKLQNNKNVAVITQNIDELHNKAKTKQIVHFHGSLYEVYCQKCFKSASAKEYLNDMHHVQCGGILRPKIVLYEEGIDNEALNQSVYYMQKADTVVIVGTSFKVYPFAGLIYEANSKANLLAINQISLNNPYILSEYIGDAVDVFKKLAKQIQE
ncbi:MAG: NAD-dependent protein deacylase [Lactobacillales bacterium]|jgi:NAD-dependent deacetylase|nr:NAD-dependent protein deacylase [Lactobacillales bacterium]